MKLKFIGYRTRKEGYEDTGYYVRISRRLISNEDFDSIKIWCELNNGMIIDHSTLFFKEKDTANNFVEMFN